MIKYENECVGCSTGILCLGDRCHNRNVRRLYCDICKDEAYKLYKVDGYELCEDCVLDKFEVVE